MADETPPEAEPEAPVISLTEVRQRRQQEAARAALSQHRQFREQWEDYVLQDAVSKKRVLEVEIDDMLRLGIVTDTPTYLPCQDRHEPADYFRWLRRAKKLPGHEEELEEDARPHYQDEPQWRIDQRLQPAPRHSVECPIMACAVIGDESPACIEALRRQAANTHLWSVAKEEFISRPLDPEDLVVKHEVRPCVVLGRYARAGLMQLVAAYAGDDPDDA